MGGRAYAWAGVAVPHTKLEDGDDGIIVHSMIIPREAEESTRLYATVLVVTLAIRASLRFDSHACGMMSHESLDKGMVQLRVERSERADSPAYPTFTHRHQSTVVYRLDSHLAGMFHPFGRFIFVISPPRATTVE